MKTAHRIPYVNLGKQNALIKDELVAAFERVLLTGNYILGEEVLKLEQNFARYCATDHAVGVNSGTDALALSLRAAGVGIGDEVITVSHTFLATASAIVMNGAHPVFIDIDKDQNMNPDLIEAAITPKTKAILPVHLTGKSAKMDRICAVAKKHGLKVIEDASQAVGAEYHGKRVGAWGDYGCFSFHPLKNLNALGDGGIITIQSEQQAQQLKIMRNIGFRTREDCVMMAGNSRLDELQAALLNVKMKYLEDVIVKRRAFAKIYRERLAAYVRVPQDTPKGRDVYHTYIIYTEHRDQLHKYLAEQGIDCKIHYPKAIHHQKPFRAYVKAEALPVTEDMVQKILSLPIDHALEKEDIETVCDSIEKFFKKI